MSGCRIGFDYHIPDVKLRLSLNGFDALGTADDDISSEEQVRAVFDSAFKHFVIFYVDVDGNIEMLR